MCVCIYYTVLYTILLYYTILYYIILLYTDEVPHTLPAGMELDYNASNKLNHHDVMT